jgi:lysophospholipase
MKVTRNKLAVSLVVLTLVLSVAYLIADWALNVCGKSSLVNKPSFKCLPSDVWDDSLATEGRLRSDQSAIEAHFNASPLEHFRSPIGDIRIAYRVFPPDPKVVKKGAIVISSGRTESMLIYDELTRDLNAHGYSVYIHDHRGQGLSDRLVEGKGDEDQQKSHVDSFDDYVGDLKSFFEIVKKAEGNQKPFLLAHSMGGAVASIYIEEYPDDFAAAVFVTPMSAAIPGWAARGAAFLQIFFPMHYALGRSGYCPAAFIDTESDLTHSRRRFERIRCIYNRAAADAKAKHTQDPRVGGVTHAWINAASNASVKLLKNAERIKIPVLVLQASDDTAVNNEAQGEFCKKAPSCQGFLLPKSFHAVFNEADTYRVPALTKILAFLDQGGKETAPSKAEPCDPWMGTSCK